jgi:hypothetical protein
MDFRKIISATVTCFIIFLTISCDNGSKDGCEYEAGYSFRDSIRIFPDDEVISKSDTLWLSCEIPKKQIDLNSNKVVDFPNAENLSAVFKILKYTTPNKAEYALDSFDIIIKHGLMIKHFLPTGALELKYENSKDFYLYKVGLVPKKFTKPGTYSFYFSEIGGVYSKSNPKICRSANISLGLKCKDQHLNLEKEHNPTATLNSGIAKRVYCFGVAE